MNIRSLMIISCRQPKKNVCYGSTILEFNVLSTNIVLPELFSQSILGLSIAYIWNIIETRFVNSKVKYRITDNVKKN